MSGAQRFFLSETNPNDGIGGGGCLCSPLKCEDASGPYAVFPSIETDSNLSPHVVICAPCAEGVCRRAQDGEVLAVGQPDKVDPVDGADF